MSAGQDEGSPAKRFADQYLKDRKEIVEVFRAIVSEMLDHNPDPVLQAKMNRQDLTINKIIL